MGGASSWVTAASAQRREVLIDQAPSDDSPIQGGLESGWVPSVEGSGEGVGTCDPVVIPVWGARPGVGTSGVALAIAEAAAAAGQDVALVDCADPARSGLVAAAPGGAVFSMGEWTIRAAQREPTTPGRGRVWVLRCAGGPAGPAASVPEPKVWLEVIDQVGAEVAALVVDTGWDPWHALGPAGLGGHAFEWCRDGGDVGVRPHPCMVMAATTPAAAAAEQCLQRYEDAGLVAPERVAVVGRTSWPDHVLGGAGVRLLALTGAAQFIATDPASVAAGWGTGPLTPQLCTPWRAWVDQLAGRPAEQDINRRRRLPFRRSTES